MARVTVRCGKCKAQQIKYQDADGSWKKEWIGGTDPIPPGAPAKKKDNEPLPTVKDKREQERARKNPPAPAPGPQHPADEDQPEASDGWLK